MRRLALFAYRTGVLESEVIKPLILCLFDPQQQPLPEEQIAKALDVVESWMVRRMLVRASTKSYTQIVAELITQLRSTNRAMAGTTVERFFAGQKTDSRYWPDDAEIRNQLKSFPAYRRLSRARLRMILEAIEDYKRGWKQGKVGLGGERVARGTYAIEHIMPRKWHTHWPLTGMPDEETEREANLHTIGNLTLLTGHLNSKVSNGPWVGEFGKRNGLKSHDVLLVNREICEAEEWSVNSIQSRSFELANTIVGIWPVPSGHATGVSRDTKRLRRRASVVDLISAGRLTPGMTLVPKRKQFSHITATLLTDGRIEVHGIAYGTLKEAALAIAKKPKMGGWGFFFADPVSRTTLRTLRREYESELAGDVGDDEGEDDADDEELEEASIAQ